MAPSSALALPYRVVRAPAGTQGSAGSRARTVAADTLWLLALVACIPFGIIAAAMPVVLALRLLLWLVKLL
jgi:hypothetical protein